MTYWVDSEGNLDLLSRMLEQCSPYECMDVVSSQSLVMVYEGWTLQIGSMVLVCVHFIIIIIIILVGGGGWGSCIWIWIGVYVG